MNWLTILLGVWAVFCLLGVLRYRGRTRAYARVLRAGQEAMRVALATPQPKPNDLSLALHGLYEALKDAEVIGDVAAVDLPPLEVPSPWQLYHRAEAVLHRLSSWTTAQEIVAAVDDARKTEQLAERAVADRLEALMKAPVPAPGDGAAEARP